MANPNEKNTIPAAAASSLKNTFAETVMPSDNKNVAAPLGTVVNDHLIEGSEIPVVVMVQKCNAAVAEFEDGDNNLEYDIVYCPTTGKGMKTPSSPGQLQPSEIINTAQTRTGSTESPQRKHYMDELQARGGAPPTCEDHGKAAERDPPAANFKFPFDLNKSPPRDDDDDGRGDIGPGLVA